MAFEKDLMTGRILKHLHPDQKVRVQGFEKIEKPFTGYFDLVISNIPFGDVAVFDPEFTGSHDPARRSAAKTIHNYFFLKSLDTVREGGIIKEGYHEEADRLRHAKTEGKDWLAQLEQSEREKTGIKNLKVKFNKVFGYYFEVTNSFKDLVPDYFIRNRP